MKRKATPKLIFEEDHWDAIARIDKHGLEGWWKMEGLSGYQDAVAFLDLVDKHSELEMGLLIDRLDEGACPYLLWKDDEGYRVAVYAAYS